MLFFIAEVGEKLAYRVDIFKQVYESRGVVLFVLLVLILLSLFSWFIIGYKLLFLRKIRVETEMFLKNYIEDKRWESLYKTASLLRSSPVSRMFYNSYLEIIKIKQKIKKDGKKSFSKEEFLENIKRALRRTMTAESTRLERFVPFLATVASAAPFIGLFGTVWGIMKAFAYINPLKPILETVTPHIAQALIATAIGLFAAIPAVMAYNYFVNKIKVITNKMDNFAQDFLNDVTRMDIGEETRVERNSELEV